MYVGVYAAILTIWPKHENQSSQNLKIKWDARGERKRPETKNVRKMEKGNVLGSDKMKLRTAFETN
jgi:hypothetical protein